MSMGIHRFFQRKWWVFHENSRFSVQKMHFHEKCNIFIKIMKLLWAGNNYLSSALKWLICRFFHLANCWTRARGFIGSWRNSIERIIILRQWPFETEPNATIKCKKVFFFVCVNLLVKSNVIQFITKLWDFLWICVCVCVLYHLLDA